MERSCLAVRRSVTTETPTWLIGGAVRSRPEGSRPRWRRDWGDGVHVAYVSIGGRVVTAEDPGPGAIPAADVADTYAKLAAQENGYTTELDLQPVR